MVDAVIEFRLAVPGPTICIWRPTFWTKSCCTLTKSAMFIRTIQFVVNWNTALSFKFGNGLVLLDQQVESVQFFGKERPTPQQVDCHVLSSARRNAPNERKIRCRRRGISSLREIFHRGQTEEVTAHTALFYNS